MFLPFAGFKIGLPEQAYLVGQDGFGLVVEFNHNVTLKIYLARL